VQPDWLSGSGLRDTAPAPLEALIVRLHAKLYRFGAPEPPHEFKASEQSIAQAICHPKIEWR